MILEIGIEVYVDDGVLLSNHVNYYVQKKQIYYFYLWYLILILA